MYCCIFSLLSLSSHLPLLLSVLCVSRPVLELCCLSVVQNFAHSTSASMTSSSILKSVVSVCSFSILLSSLYNSSEYSFHLFFIPSSSPITFPSLDFREPILGLSFLVISFTFENISLVLPFFPSSSITLHMSFFFFVCSCLFLECSVQ